MGKVQTSTTAKGTILKRKEIVIIDDTICKVKKLIDRILYLNDLITFRYHLYYGILHKLTILKELSTIQ